MQCNSKAMKPMKLKFLFLILLTGLGVEAAAQRSEFAIGPAFYAGGEFKQAVAHFQLPYQPLADIAFPFAGKYGSKVRVYLTKATELAPGRLDYRRPEMAPVKALPDSSIRSQAATATWVDMRKVQGPSR